MDSAAISVEQALALAHQHHAGGRLPEAEQIYNQILASDPNEPNTLHLLGVLANQSGRADRAVDLISRAISLRPKVAEFYSNLGVALANRGDLDKAVAAYHIALQLKPGLAEAHNNLGNALKAGGKMDQAVTSYRAALSANPNYADAYSNLGDALVGLSQLNDAVIAYQTAVQIDPSRTETYHNLGNVLILLGEPKNALEAYRAAVQLDPAHFRAQNNIGCVLRALGDLPNSINYYRAALRLKPDSAEVYNNLGTALEDTGELDDALTAYEQAIRFDPRLACAYSNLIYAAHFSPAFDAALLLKYSRRFSHQFEPSVGAIISHNNDPSPTRRLRIGYVSADFREHSVGRFLPPLLRNHDERNFEVICYSDVKKPDPLTNQLRQFAHVWVESASLSNNELAARVRADHIDLLIDLAVHSGDNRLLVFAQKPAPVQITWLGYPGTTGLSTVDYRLTDPFLDPPDETDAFYTEQSVRLPHCFWCFDAASSTLLDVNPLPAIDTGVVTFASFNNFMKVTKTALHLWADLLAIVPGSRLALYAPQDNHRERVLTTLGDRGIKSDRIRFIGRQPLQDFLAEYHNVDIMLDTFPYAGGTTTCDALWMGVPVVTLRGHTAVGRGGVSILSNIGLTDWIADNTETYVAIAANAAKDLPKLANLRATLRTRMQQSPLMNAPRFATEMESAYREMWRKWCTDKTK